MTPTEEKRKEMIQEIIDRMLYLPDIKKRVFLDIIQDSFEVFPLEYTINDRGIRVYTNTNKKQELCA